MGCLILVLIEIGLSIAAAIYFGKGDTFWQIASGVAAFIFMNLFIFSSGGFYDEPP